MLSVTCSPPTRAASRYVFVICVQTISTTHLRGKTWKPLGAMSFSQSRATPSLAHSSAHALSTSSGAGFFGRSSSSTVHPRVFSVPNLHPYPLRGSHRPATDLGGAGRFGRLL